MTLIYSTKQSGNRVKLKILVTGPFNAGKTTFIKTISEIPPVLTERKIVTWEFKVKETTTVAMDYGRVTFNGYTIHLFGTPGQERFNFMLEVLSRGVDGCVILLDGTSRDLQVQLERFIDIFKDKGVPVIIGINKCDLKRETTDFEDVKLNINHSEIPVLGIIARNRGSTISLLKKLVALIERKRESKGLLNPF